MCRQRRPNSLVSQVRRRESPSAASQQMSCMSCISSHLSNPHLIPPSCILPSSNPHTIFKIVIVPASASSRPADFPISAKAKGAPLQGPAVSDGACASSVLSARHDCATGSSRSFAYGELISHGKSEPQHRSRKSKRKKIDRIAERQAP